MKTWLVILHLGRVVGAMPFDGDVRECRDAAEDREWLLPRIEAAGYDVDAVTLDCVRISRPPPIGEDR